MRLVAKRGPDPTGNVESVVPPYFASLKGIDEWKRTCSDFNREARCLLVWPAPFTVPAAVGLAQAGGHRLYVGGSSCALRSFYRTSAWWTAWFRSQRPH